MMNKKYIAILAVVVAVVSSMYTVYETTPTRFVYGGASFTGLNFEEMVEQFDLTVVGEITNIDVRVMPEVVDTWVDKNDVEQVDRISKPEKEITFKIDEILRDKIGIESDTIVFYDRLDEGLGKINGETVEFHEMYAVDLHVGDKGIWILNVDEEGHGLLQGSGYAAYYPIYENQDTITTELDKVTNDPPIDLESAKKTAKRIAQSDQ